MSLLPRPLVLVVLYLLCLSVARVSSWTLPSLPVRTRNTCLYMNQQNPSERHDAMLEFMNQEMDNMVGDVSDSLEEEEDDPELLQLVECIAKAADDRKAENIVALNVRPISTLTSYLVILSGNSRPQNQAIAASITDAVQEDFDDLKTIGNGVPEGTADSGWMLLDYGSVMVHIMTPRSRLFYDIETQWREKGGTEVDLSHILVPNTMVEVGEEAAMGGTMNVAEEDDPFWS